MIIEYKHFNQALVPVHDIIRVDSPTGRLYKWGDHVYPSITTVLSKSSDKDYLTEWKNRIGEDKANEISDILKDRGNGLHLIIERYITNKPDIFSGMNAAQKFLFTIAKKHLDKIDSVVGNEIPLMSKKLQIAGTCDCIAYYEGVLSIIDFKNARGDKSINDIDDYWVQAAFYFFAFVEMYGIVPKQLIIIIASAQGMCYVYKKQITSDLLKDYATKLKELRKLYDE